MSGVTMDIDGDKELMATLQRLGKRGRQEAQKSVNAMSQRVRTESIRRIQRGPKTGRVYTKDFRTIGGKAIPITDRADVPNLSSSHQASAPGEAPATDTGNLASSIHAQVSGMSGRVGTNERYGLYLEIGTRGMAARPWLFPTLEENRDWYIERIKDGIERAIQEASK